MDSKRKEEKPEWIKSFIHLESFYDTTQNETFIQSNGLV